MPSPPPPSTPSPTGTRPSSSPATSPPDDVPPIIEDDVFSTSPIHSPSDPGPHNEPSDIPRLRSTHTTCGYRDGIAASKAESLQPGFDEGYSLGAVFGLRVGWILGVLEGICAALQKQRGNSTHTMDGFKGADSGDGRHEHIARDSMRVEKLCWEARGALQVEKLFARPYWKEDGTWDYEVEGEEGETTFREVVEQHPVVKEWVTRVRELMERYMVKDEGFGGEEWERGRVDVTKGDGG